MTSDVAAINTRDIQRPRLVTAGAVAMAIVAVFVLCGGLATLASGVLLTLFYRAMGGSVDSIVLVVMGVGVVLIIIGGVEAYAARRVLAGARWARKVGLVMALVLGLLGALNTWAAVNAVEPGAAIGFGLLLLVANVVVLITLTRTSRWFATRDDDRPGMPRTSVLRRLSPWLAVGAGSVAVVVMLAASLGVTGDDSPLAYLRSFPENDLAYPDATPTSAHDRAEDAWFDGASTATTEHGYVATASEADVKAWYSVALAARGWEASHLISAGSGGERNTPQWLKDFATLQMVGLRSETPSTTSFTVRILATGVKFDDAPLAALQALPAARLAYAGSTLRRVREDVGRSTGATSVQPAEVSRNFETSASVGEVQAYVENELAAQGWQPLQETRGDVLGSWTNGNAVLRFSARRVTTSDPPVTRYSLLIAEVLGPDATPGLPWR